MRVRRGILVVCAAALLTGLLTVPASASSTVWVNLMSESVPGGGTTCAVVIKGQVPLGANLTFQNFYGSKVTVRDQVGFWSFSVANKGTTSRTMYHAGTYEWQCHNGSYSKNSVNVSLPSSSSGSFKVTWATSQAAGSYRYTVEYKVGSSGTVQTWKTSTSARSAKFNPGHHNTYYYFRAETFRNASSVSGFSAWKKIDVT